MKKVTRETAIKHEIRDYLQFNGWFVFHNLQSLGSYKGIPDITACKRGIVLFIEVKTPTGKQNENQIKFENDITDAGCFYLVARGYEDVSKYILDRCDILAVEKKENCQE